TSNIITNTLIHSPGDLALLQTTQMINHYQGLAADPPDANFQQLSPLTAAAPIERLDNDPVRSALLQVADNLRFESAIADGLLHGTERYQGADEAGDAQWALIHARAVRDDAGLLRDRIG